METHSNNIGGVYTVNLSAKDNYILINLESEILNGKDKLISRQRFSEFSQELDIPNPDEIDEIYDILMKKFGYSDTEIGIFLENWTPKVSPQSNQVNQPVEKSFTDIFAGWDDDDDDEIDADNNMSIDSIYSDAELTDNLNTIQNFSDNRRLIALYQNVLENGNLIQKQKIEEKAVQINEKLVRKIAIKYSGAVSSVSLNTDDLYILGNIGMLKALKRFDLNQPNTFSTYAVTWIRQSITRAIADEGTTIRMPVHYYEKIQKFNRVKRELYKRDGLISEEKVAEAMDTTVKKVKDYEEKSRMVGGIVSIDIPIGDDGDINTLGNIYPLSNIFNDDEFDLLINEMKREDRDTLYNQLLKELTPREVKVLNLRYGLDDDNSRTLEEIGKMMGVTRERIRQIQAKSLLKLKNVAIHNKKLYPYNYEPQEVGK